MFLPYFCGKIIQTIKHFFMIEHLKKHKKLVFRKWSDNPIVRFFESMIIISVSGIFLLVGMLFLWVSLLQVPPLEGFHERIVSNSTKIYDRTGKVVLYDILGKQILSQILQNGKNKINVTKMIAGIYTLTFSENTGIKNSSIIIE